MHGAAAPPRLPPGSRSSETRREESSADANHDPEELPCEWHFRVTRGRSGPASSNHSVRRPRGLWALRGRLLGSRQGLRLQLWVLNGACWGSPEASALPFWLLLACLGRSQEGVGLGLTRAVNEQAVPAGQVASAKDASTAQYLVFFRALSRHSSPQYSLRK